MTNLCNVKPQLCIPLNGVFGRKRRNNSFFKEVKLFCLYILKWLQERGCTMTITSLENSSSANLVLNVVLSTPFWNTLPLWCWTVCVPPTYNYNFVYPLSHVSAQMIKIQTIERRYTNTTYFSMKQPILTFWRRIFFLIFSTPCI